MACLRASLRCSPLPADFPVKTDLLGRKSGVSQADASLLQESQSKAVWLGLTLSSVFNAILLAGLFVLIVVIGLKLGSSCRQRSTNGKHHRRTSL